MPNIPLTYEEFCLRINDGDIVEVGRGSWFSWVVRTIIGGKWSHVGFVYRDANRQLMMFEGRPGDSKAVPLSNYRNRKLGLIHTPVDPTESRRLWESMAGTDYAYRQLLSIAIHERLGWPYVIDEPDEACCSVLVARVLIKMGIPLYEVCSPEYLAKQLDALGHFIVAETA